MGTATLVSTPFHCTVVAEASAAPTRPPISACDEDDGRPKYQVIRFQVIAPITAAITTVIPFPVLGVLITPLATVTATPVPASAPSRFITPASASAPRSESALVETAEAMALAAS